MRIRAQEGFSLIEIVIAVTIVAIVTAGVVPVVFRQLAKAKMRTTKTMIKSIQQEIQEFHSDTGAYPAQLEDLKVRPSDERIAKRWDGPYIEGKLADGWGHEFVYSVNQRGAQPPYDLYSWGKDGEGSPEEEWIRAQES